MVKNGSENSASGQLIVKLIRSLHCQVRPQREISFQLSQGSVSRIKSHLIASCNSSQKDQWHWSRALSDSDHHLIDIASSLKNCERPPFDLAVSLFHSLSGILGSPLLSLSSSRVTLAGNVAPSYRECRAQKAQNARKVSKRSSRACRPRVPKKCRKSRKSHEKVPTRDFFVTFSTFSALF